MKYFGNAFLSFAVAFTSRFAILLSEAVSVFWVKSVVEMVLSLIFYYTLSLAGFYLVYSLVWKNLQGLSWKEGLLHAAAILISFLTFFSDNLSVVFVTQLVVLSYAIFISYSNYRLSKRNTVRQLFFIALVLAFVGYLANYLAIFIEPFFPSYILYVYAITTVIFLIILFGAYNG